MTSYVDTRQHGQHVLLTLNRPAKLNALSYGLIDELMGHLDALETDPAVRTVILTGQGERAFSAGADIAGFAPDIAISPEQAHREFLLRGQALTRRLETYPKPVIAAVNGLAFGGGCEVVEACSLAVAATHATFSKPEIRLGFPPTFGGTQRLPRHVGRKRAIEMILTGDAIDADTARRIGLINQVVPAAELLPACLALADRIARHAPRAVTAALRAVTRGINVTIDEGLAIEGMQFMIAAASADAREGTRAFLEKREPRLSGL
ncbi:enoyl-CoA hydratase [Cupriavidus sp. USMAA2-4]|uniref:Enoyl-CoA hydratase n=1 Tax=Cupriavidus malaysiensis TaxID=367825 RepID=A0ABM6FDE7_9BURK|nr:MULTISPECIES: crotonase/enoyl-CoA hydratase family protein [Cupriavidus]AOY96739.1 enoyl-CoA hydratase [Cupriavidus sp. USMAA2-4]AOZ02858.1 enoyl-CoA hydratase [Cupriavidus sp. USMAHM13]AOZ09770.1 enoyl-CoA hydratase [Cupriavidus malaysiensis]